MEPLLAALDVDAAWTVEIIIIDADKQKNTAEKAFDENVPVLAR